MKRSTFWEGGFCASDTNICGSASRSSPCRRMLPTTPTTVYHGPSKSSGPNFNLLPTGSCPGHERRASASLTIATRGASGRSPIEKKRPPSNGVLRVLKEIRADLVSCKQQALGHRSGVALDRQGLFPRVTSEQIVDDAGALDTRHRLNLFEQAVVQVVPLRGGIEGGRGCDVHHKDPLRPESRINVVHVPPASDEQTGADEQNDRERKLRYHEGAADSTAGCSARHTSATLRAGWTQIAAHRCHRRRQSHQDSRQERHGQGQPEDAEIEAHFVQARQVARAEGTDEANACHGEQCASQA